jgi:hypothetical protein
MVHPICFATPGNSIKPYNMKRLLILLLITSCVVQTHAQFVHKIKADSVLITNDSCTAELNLENSTKHIKGFLYNKGNGRTEFKKVVKINDSSFIMGSDTLVMGGTPKNLATASLIATGNYAHNWKGFDLNIDSVKQFNLWTKGFNTFFQRHVKVQYFASSGFTSIPLYMGASIRNVANSSDSIINEIYTLGGKDLQFRSVRVNNRQARLVLEQGVNTSNALLEATSLSNYKAISIVPDSINFIGALSKETADSIYAVGPYNSFFQTNALYKIPSSVINKNLANSQLRATVNVGHNWAGNTLAMDSIGILSLVIRKTRFNAKKITTIFADGDVINPISMNYRTRNTADNLDSMFTTMNIDANHAVNLESQNIPFSRSAKIQLAAGSSIGGSSVINIMADTVRIRAKPKSTADSIFAVGPHNSTLQANAIYKIPASAIGGGALLSGELTSIGNVDINLSSLEALGYDRIDIQFDCSMGTDNRILFMRFSSNGTTFDAGATDYEWGNAVRITGNGTGSQMITSSATGGASECRLSSGLGNASDETTRGKITLYEPFATTYRVTYDGQMMSHATNGLVIKNELFGQRQTAQKCVAVRFYLDSGNFSRFNYRVYGYKN